MNVIPIIITHSGLWRPASISNTKGSATATR